MGGLFKPLVEGALGHYYYVSRSTGAMLLSNNEPTMACGGDGGAVWCSKPTQLLKMGSPYWHKPPATGR